MADEEEKSARQQEAELLAEKMAKAAADVASERSRKAFDEGDTETAAKESSKMLRADNAYLRFRGMREGKDKDGKKKHHHGNIHQYAALSDNRGEWSLVQEEEYADQDEDSRRHLTLITLSSVGSDERTEVAQIVSNDAEILQKKSRTANPTCGYRAVTVNKNQRIALSSSH
jgi:hypothetical protein